MKRKFEEIMNSLKDSIATYNYFVDFNKAIKNVENIEIELNLLNVLIGKENIEEKFRELITKYPKVINILPILIAVRKKELKIVETEEIDYNFKDKNINIDLLLKLMNKTGLFDLFKNKKIKNVVDYVLGIEVGLDTNARKNRTGTAMETIVENYIKRIPGIDYLVQPTTKMIKDKWNINTIDSLVFVDEEEKNNKKFDFAIKTNTNKLLLIETNFYNTSGSKLNETARSYTKLASYIDKINNVEFIWITDGKGWLSTKNNLHEAYQNIKHLYTLLDLENGILEELNNV